MKRTVLALLLLLAPAAHAQGPAEGARALARVFGTQMALAGEFRPALLSADLDGDGRTDRVVMARLRGARSRLPAGVRLLHPWGDTVLAAGQLSLVVLPGRGGAYVVTGRAFFDSPMWKKPWPGMLSVVQRKGRPAVVVPTEAGIDTYLHWTGRGYAVEHPEGEVP